MKRRVLLASSIAGMTSISGCMGIFSGNEDKNKDESTTDTEDQEIELPHDELEPNSLSPNFLDTHIHIFL